MADLPVKVGQHVQDSKAADRPDLQVNKSAWTRSTRHESPYVELSHHLSLLDRVDIGGNLMSLANIVTLAILAAAGLDVELLVCTHCGNPVLQPTKDGNWRRIVRKPKSAFTVDISLFTTQQQVWRTIIPPSWRARHGNPRIC